MRKLRLFLLLTALWALILGIPISKSHSTAQAKMPAAASPPNLDDSRMKEIANKLVGTAEYSSTDWQAHYGDIQNNADGHGYTAGIIGFTTADDDLLQLVQNYKASQPGNTLAGYIPDLQKASGVSSPDLGDNFVRDWKAAAQDPVFQKAQRDLRDSTYFDPAVKQAKADQLSALGQFIYYDAIVNHGPGNRQVDCQHLPQGSDLARLSFPGLRQVALCKAKTPAAGGDQATFLKAFLDARSSLIEAKYPGHSQDRIAVQRQFIKDGNFDLTPPLKWTMHKDQFQINALPSL